MTQTVAARRLDATDSTAVARALDADPVQNVYLRSEVRLGSLRTGAWWGLGDDDDGGLRSVMAGGALVVPWLAASRDAIALAAVLDHQRRPQLMTGPRDHVIALQQARQPAPPTREVRDPQPLMVLRRGALTGDGDSRVRRGEPRDLDLLTFASGAMHREEMGVDPLSIDPSGWRFRMATLIDRGWSFVWTERGEVLFKAELSAWTPDVCQVQGVFTAPSRRGRGVGRAGMAAVCSTLLREVPAVSLYVNHFNAPAVRLYSRLGFEHVADFATLFY